MRVEGEEESERTVAMGNDKYYLAKKYRDKIKFSSIFHQLVHLTFYISKITPIFRGFPPFFRVVDLNEQNKISFHYQDFKCMAPFFNQNPLQSAFFTFCFSPIKSLSLQFGPGQTKNSNVKN